MEKVRAVLTGEETIERSDPRYEKQSQVWSHHKNLHPQFLARPKNAESLSRLLKVLNETDVEFNVRGGGCGSASSRGVLISTAAFDDFEFTAESDGNEAYAIVGAGLLWGEVDRKMEELAPGYALVGARCSYLGVGGTTLQGGLGWLSSEYGLTSDPSNLLDAFLVLMDGTSTWASCSPDLLWALRGGGGAFGVVTKFKFRARRYARSIYSGMIVYPREALDVLAREVARFTRENADPKVAMHFYCLDLVQGAFVGRPSVPGLAVLVYDARGEEHGREVFSWALGIPGARDATRAMSYREVVQQGDELEAIRGQTNQMMTAVVIPGIDEETIHRTFEWFDDALIREPKLSAGTFVLIEIMQKAAFQSVERGATGWPRPRGRHILQLGCGALSREATPEVHRTAVDVLAKGAEEILQHYEGGNCLPRDYEEFHDSKEMFGENMAKLVEIKRRVDPNNRVAGAFLL